MLKSKVEVQNEKPYLFIEGKCVPALAYTTYFEERSRYEDFVDAGYKIFFVNVSFTTLPINTFTGFTPFRTGVFENPQNPDYVEFEDAVHKILKKCPDAVIFPRIYISMPSWWTELHPEDTAPAEKGGNREIMFSEAFRKDGERLLVQLINHIKKSDYSGRIGGWMICGGLTQEWMYRSYNGNICEGAKEPYRKWAKENYGEENAQLPGIDEYKYEENAFQTSENARRYAIFCNFAMAETIEHFAKAVKRETAEEQVVGTFYGYTFETLTPLFGSYGLGRIISSPYIDFYSSPNSYMKNRSFGIDWADMMPVDSIKKHGKLAFIECDIRTYLTTAIQEARPGEYPDDIYKVNGVSLWVGPPTAELSRMAIRKSFAHQITKASAIWWFDMWGGWYNDPLLMNELVKLREIYTDKICIDEKLPRAEAVFFADECAYANMFARSPQIVGAMNTRVIMGNAGAPYDVFMVEDAESILKNYKVAIFPFPTASDAGKKAMKLCEDMGIPYLAASEDHCEFTAAEIRNFYSKNGVHLYTAEEDVIYVGGGYIGFHSASGGNKKINLPGVYGVEAIFGADMPEKEADVLVFTLEENDTALFKLKYKK